MWCNFLEAPAWSFYSPGLNSSWFLIAWYVNLWTLQAFHGMASDYSSKPITFYSHCPLQIFETPPKQNNYLTSSKWLRAFSHAIPSPSLPVKYDQFSRPISNVLCPSCYFGPPHPDMYAPPLMSIASLYLPYVCVVSSVTHHQRFQKCGDQEQIGSEIQKRGEMERG